MSPVDTLLVLCNLFRIYLILYQICLYYVYSFTTI